MHPQAYEDPQHRRVVVSNAVLGMLLFIFTEVMLFAGLVSAHVIVRAGAQEWPPFGQPRLPVIATFLNSLVLLSSGIALAVAHSGFTKHAAGAARALTAAWLLGAFFVVFQGREWAALIGEGLTITSSPYGAFFYLIVGMHALHALAALLALAWAWLRLRAGTLSAPQLSAVAIFWYFVVLVWPVLYVRVYL
jgi:cytochrome c oxidase subunit 3